MTRKEAVECWIIPAIENMWKEKKCKEIIEALEQEPCEEYESDLKTIIDDILEEGNQLISKKDILRRFKEVDEEYKGMSWNLLQILTNINILIGQEPCDDCVSRSAVKNGMIKYGFHASDMTVTEFVEDELAPVLPKREQGEWVGDKAYPICPKCNCNIIEEYISCSDYAEMYKPMKYCPNCGAEMR